ncbi:MAG: acylphosphatase [Nitriliruptoraceae bacterium]
MVEADRTVARRVVARGRVQGVFFRASAQDQAQHSGVVGWIRNRADGAVEAWLEGPPGAVDALEQWIRDGGPPRAHVEDVEVVAETPAGHVRFEAR